MALGIFAPRDRQLTVSKQDIVEEIARENIWFNDK